MAAAGDETAGSDGESEIDETEPAVRPTRRARAKSAALWGLVGGFAVLALAQGVRLVAGDLPVGSAGLVGLAAAIALASGGIAYATEHRLRAKRVKRRT